MALKLLQTKLKQNKIKMEVYNKTFVYWLKLHNQFFIANIFWYSQMHQQQQQQNSTNK